MTTAPLVPLAEDKLPSETDTRKVLAAESFKIGSKVSPTKLVTAMT